MGRDGKIYRSPSRRRRYSPSPSPVRHGRRSRRYRSRSPYSYSRRQQELELKLIEEETAQRVAGKIRKKVEESLNSEEMKLEIVKRLEEGRKKLVGEVALNLKKKRKQLL